MGYVEERKCGDRHKEFVQSIFIDVSDATKSKPEEIEDIAINLDELLARIFDDE